MENELENTDREIKSSENLPVVHQDQAMQEYDDTDKAEEGKDIARITQELITANMFGDDHTSVANITKDILEDAMNLAKEFSEKRADISLDTIQDKIINGQLYNDLANKSVDAVKLKLDVLNAISKFVPKKNGTSVNIAQQLNADTNVHGNMNTLNPVQFNQIIEHAETKGLNPMTAYRKIEADYENEVGDGMHDYEEVEDDEDGETEERGKYNEREIDVIYSPKPEDFDG